MTPENFCYWLQGYIELTSGEGDLTEQQVQMIKDHLKLVFKKETPIRGKDLSELPWNPSYPPTHSYFTITC